MEMSTDDNFCNGQLPTIPGSSALKLETVKGSKTSDWLRHIIFKPRQKYGCSTTTINLLRVYNEQETQRKDELITKTTLPPS